MWCGDGRLVVGVEREDTHRLAVTAAGDAWPRRLATEHGELDERGDEREAAVSPDGGEVAYAFYPRADLNRSEIRVAAVDGGEVRALTGTSRIRDREPAWSPDGERNTFASERSGFYELHLVGRDGSGERQLTEAGADHIEIDWHPDGRRLAVTRGRRNRFDLVVVDRESGEAEMVAEGGMWSSPRWTAWKVIVAGYEDHATPPELRIVAPGCRAGRAARARAGQRAGGPVRRARGA